MIKFFRHIRQRLLSENKPASSTGRFSKYLLYAIGEIVLVVIGILIALQINNWNEDRKVKIQEIKTLEFLRDAMIQDTIMLNDHRDWLSVTEYGIVNTLKELENKTSSDSLGKSLNLALNQPTFNSNRAAYESLKANGPNIISNDSLRNAIIFYYESDSEWIENRLERIELPASELLHHSIDLFENLSHYDRITEKSWHVRSLIPHELEVLQKDKRFKTLLNTKLINTQYKHNFSYTQGMKGLKMMLAALEKEIKILKD